MNQSHTQFSAFKAYVKIDGIKIELILILIFLGKTENHMAIKR